MIKKPILELIYDAASIQRWNDHIRPSKGFTELDKQAHKMVFAYVISKFEESDRKVIVNWKALIEGGIFEFLHRIVLTDIKPPIFHKLMEQKGEKLNLWVFEQLRDRFTGTADGFFQKFETYLMEPSYCALEKRILKAAHYLATNWEFGIIYNMNLSIYGLEDTRAEIENEIEDHYDLAGVQKMSLGKKTKNFMDLVGQLRFQQRWAQSPRVPETSVMGHMLVVAILSYLCSLELGACEKRVVNNYFGGLFHDLPEVLTRDIISPVKKSVEGIDELIKEIESIQVEERILPLLPSSWHKEIKYFIENEFKSKIVEDGKVVIVSSSDINEKFNSDNYQPLDGEIIRACDHLAAFIEAYLSISHGITSHNIEDGHNSLYKQYSNREIAGIDFSKLFDYFKL
jgi:putative hydrolase of HD superfamily